MAWIAHLSLFIRNSVHLWPGSSLLFVKDDEKLDKHFINLYIAMEIDT